MGKGKHDHPFLRTRMYVQACWTLLTNSYASGFINGVIYQGKIKSFCVPGLNCYSCPGALGACPMGALQNAIAGRGGGVPFYVLGFLVTIGALVGRIVCGWLCPFGLVQDLLHKLPLKKKLRRLPGEMWLRRLKYVVLAVTVVLLPALLKGEYGIGDPWFCKWICPSGTLLGGLPLMAVNPELRSVVGGLFAWKVFILAAILAASVFIFRPFCRYLCPLGAIYGAMNPVSLCRMWVNRHSCTSCGACQKACGLDIAPYKTPNSPDCIRCGKCIRACPNDALSICVKITKKRRIERAEG